MFRVSAWLKLTWTYSSALINGRKRGGFYGHAFSGVLSVRYVDNGCLYKVVGFQSLVVHCFLLPQIIVVVVCHWMRCKLIKLDSSFLPKWKAKLVKEGLI